MRPVEVLNMTRLFDKEMLIYSFFDIRLKKPARVIMFVYLILLGLIWTLPLFLIFGMGNPYLAALELGVPFVGATLMSKPIWGGKKFFDFMLTQIKYLARPKVYYDCVAGKKLHSYKIDHTILISRRRDYSKLKEMKRRRLSHA